MVDEMDLLSRMKDAAPLRAESFEEARTKLCAAMAVNAHPETELRQGGHPQKLTWGTRGKGGTGGKVGVGITAVAAAAAAVAVLGVTSSPTPSHPAASHPAASHPAASHPAASHPASRPGVQQAAWTVARKADGTIQVSFFGQLRDPAGLQRTLRADGVPTSVTYIGQQNPACLDYPSPPSPPSPPRGPGFFPGPLSRVVGSPFSRQSYENPQDATMVIHPSALPSGAGLQIAVMRGIPSGPAGPWPYPKGSGHPEVEVSLVKASRQCTGS
jgi:hypothetical protein